MNKLYFLITLAGVAVFGAVYANFNSGYEASIAATRKAADDERKVAAARDAETRTKAMHEAVASQERRKKEAADLEKQEEARKVARQEAEDARAKAFEDRRRFRDQAERIRKDVEGVKAEIDKIAAEKKRLDEEKVFLADVVAKARANARSYTEVLEKLDAAEKSRAAVTVTSNR